MRSQVNPTAFLLALDAAAQSLADDLEARAGGMGGGLDGAAARTPRGCALQVEQVGGAMRSPLTSFWSHTDSDVLISFLCVLQTRSASKPRLTGDQARFGVTASQRKYAAEVELWMADSVAALGAHNAGAYQGYLHERDAPEALYGELGVARLQVRLGLKLTPRGV